MLKQPPTYDTARVRRTHNSIRRVVWDRNAGSRILLKYRNTGYLSDPKPLDVTGLARFRLSAAFSAAGGLVEKPQGPAHRLNSARRILARTRLRLFAQSFKNLAFVRS